MSVVGKFEAEKNKYAAPSPDFRRQTKVTMQNKGAIRFFAILMGLTCLFYLSFSWVTRKVEKEARAAASEYVSKPEIAALAKNAGNAEQQQLFVDSTRLSREVRYLDSLKKKPVYDLGITSFTYETCKEREINLGLDLRGGMNVTLEISVADIIRNMSGKPDDTKFKQAIANAKVREKKEKKNLVDLFAEEMKKLDPGSNLAAYFRTIELKGKVDYNTKDEDVVKLIKERLDEAITTSEKTLRTRIDKFGVTQPVIQKLEASGRILIELPGVSDKSRVRKLLQGTANLEFWETHDNKDIFGKLVDADKKLKELLSPELVKDTTKKEGDSSRVVLGTKTKEDSLKLLAKQDSLKDVKSDTVKKKIVDLLGNDTGKQDTNALLTHEDSVNKATHENPLFSLMTPVYDQKSGPKEGPVVGMAFTKDTARIMELLRMERVRKIFPDNVKFAWSNKPRNGVNESVLEMIALKITTRDGKAALYGDIISDAQKEYDQQNAGAAHISMVMTDEAAQSWSKLTKDNIGKSIAIVLDNLVYSFPTVQGQISGGQSQITGDFSSTEADDLVNILKAGKLPAPARIVEETVVGPTLGQESIDAGFKSFAIALAVVLLFMGLYYNKAGWVANMALFVNMFFIVGILSSLNAVLTLPGIAGIVLVIALSVDANILIFERIREELRLGKGLQLAIAEGYKNAMSSILDSNITTLLLGIILFAYGSGPVQGFATTLIIGILTSLFCGIFITRIIFERLLKNKNAKLPFSIKATENTFRKVNINFVGKRKWYYLFSGAIIALGVIFFFKNGGFNLGVDFKGGRTYHVNFETPVETEKVGEALRVSFGSRPEVKTFGENNKIKITTSYLIDENNDDTEIKVEEKLNSGLQTLNNKYQIVQSQKVGETISRDIKVNSFWTIAFSCLIMFLYILIRFKGWHYGLGATVALFHDVAIIFSCYAIFDGLLPFSLEIDQHFVAAILTVMGYSMTDTVVVFDRIREYLAEHGKKELESREEKERIINFALNNTLSRTIITSLTTFFVLLTIFIFGGEVIKGFAFALLIGIIIGTYSSLCIATPIVIDFDRKKKAVGV